MKRWTDEEKEELERICESGWDWEFPGYKWVAEKLKFAMEQEHDDYKPRSAAACRKMDKKICENKRTEPVLAVEGSDLKPNSSGGILP